MDYIEIEKKILECMHKGEGYRPSDIGCYVFGMWRVDDGVLRIPYKPQGHSLAIGKHLRRMAKEKKIYTALHEPSKKILWYKI